MINLMIKISPDITKCNVFLFVPCQVSLGGFVTLKFFGAFAGHVIEFTVRPTSGLFSEFTSYRE